MFPRAPAKINATAKRNLCIMFKIGATLRPSQTPKRITILGGFPVSQKMFLFWGRFPKWIFAEGRSTRSLWCLEKIQGPIWRSKEHLVMKGLSKNVKNHEILLFHYSVRQKIGDPGSISTQNMFPLIPVVPKPSQLPYGAKYCSFISFSVFSPIGPLLDPYFHQHVFQLKQQYESWRLGVYFDAKYASAHPRRTKTPSIAIWSNIFCFGRKSGFLVFSPIGPSSPHPTPPQH